MNTSHRSLRIAVSASVLALALVIADSVAIALDGGSGESSLEFLLFLSSIVVMFASAVALGLHWSTGRPAVVRTATCLGLLAAATLLVVAIQVVVEAVQPENPGWAWGEVNLWVLSAAMCALALWSARRTTVHEPLTAGRRQSVDL